VTFDVYTQDFGNLQNWFFGGGMPGGGRFESTYRVHSVAFVNRGDLEGGGKIILPPSALDLLTRLHIEYPMLFEITNRSENRKMHSGVLEFVADEGMCYMPFWMMQNLLLEEGALVNIRSTSLPRGKFVKFQPHTKNFLDIANPRAVLESSLRKFTCLTKGDVIVINYNKKNYYLTVLETKPADAISIVETDIEVDFAAPLDYVEPTPQPKQESVPEATSAMSIPSRDKGKAPAVEEDDSKNRFIPFGGSGQSLRTPTGTSPVPISQSPKTPISASPSPSPSTSFGSGNKLVFGGRAPAPQQKKQSDDEEESDSDEEDKKPKFVAFGGKGYSLKG
jgi:ubiquitin fusion degradation protein 1